MLSMMMMKVVMICVLALESCILGGVLYSYVEYVNMCIRAILVEFNSLRSYRV